MGGFEKTTAQKRPDFSAAHQNGSKAIQKKSVSVIQKAAPEEEVQQYKSDVTVQREEAPAPEEEASGVLQHKTFSNNPVNEVPAQRKENKTGMPDYLKSGIENLSGMSMDHVKVHYNSSQPAQLNALAYAQGSDIHVGPGQEKHLPHEAWHVVQQAQGRVQPTTQMKAGVAVNDDPGLEHEADVMGEKALQVRPATQLHKFSNPSSIQNQTIQRWTYQPGTTRDITVQGNNSSKTFEECTYNKVSFNQGDYLPTSGTVTSTPANWGGWLKNQNNHNNATQLHVVNRLWGGKGGQNEKNIVPGTPAVNSHHLHEAEKIFKQTFFTGKGQANQNCIYECKATPTYPTNIDVTGGKKIPTGDPAIWVQLTDQHGNTKQFNVSPGGGLYFTDGS